VSLAGGYVTSGNFLLTWFVRLFTLDPVYTDSFSTLPRTAQTEKVECPVEQVWCCVWTLWTGTQPHTPLPFFKTTERFYAGYIFASSNILW